MNLGDVIKQYRTKNELTLRDFAERTNLSYSYIGMLEKNYNYRSKKPLSPSLEVVKTIAEAMGLSLDDLLDILDDNQLITINNVIPANMEQIPIVRRYYCGSTNTRN